MLDRAERSILLFWLMFWVSGWIFQTNALISHIKPLQQPSSRPAHEVLQVKWFVRMLFGLSPRNDELKLRAAIMQSLALLMAVVEIAIKRSFNIENLLSLTGILMLIYVVLLFLVAFLLDHTFR